MLGLLDLGSLALLTGIVLALAVPLYVFGAYRAHREVEAHEQEAAGKRRALEDRIVQLERGEPRDLGAQLPEASSGILLHDPEPPAAPDPGAPIPSDGADVRSGDRPSEEPDPTASDEDPWTRAFEGCLRGREVLDRGEIPGGFSRYEQEDGNPEE